MLRIGIQLEPKRKALYEEAIRRLKHVTVTAEPHPDGRIIDPLDAQSDHEIPCLVDEPERLGKDVLTECIQADRNFMPAHEWRFRPKVQPMHEALITGKLGKPGLMRLHDWSNGDVPLKQRMFGPIDLACWFFQSEPAACHSIQARGSLLCHLKFPNDGMALVDVTKHSAGGSVYESIQLIGATGAAYGDDHHNTHLQFRNGGVSARIHHLDLVHGLMGMVSEFANGLLEDRDWNVSLNDSARVVQQMKGLADG